MCTHLEPGECIACIIRQYGISQNTAWILLDDADTFDMQDRVTLTLDIADIRRKYAPMDPQEE
jgi:hypothetical protein